MSINIIKYDLHDCVNSITGFTASLWFAGCSHRCKGCFNPESWNPKLGKPWTDEIKEEIFMGIKKYNLKNISFLGGDILCTEEGRRIFVNLVKEIKVRLGIRIYIWTGYTKEQADEFLPKDIYEHIDYFIDGTFIEEQKNLNLKLRGSSNQKVYRFGELSNL